MQHLAEDAPHWRYTEQPPCNTKLALLTRGGMQVVGVWQGNFGDIYIAWAGLIKRNKELEAQLGYGTLLPKISSTSPKPVLGR